MISQSIVYGSTFSFTPIIAKELGAGPIGLSVVTLFHLFPQIMGSPYASGKLLQNRGETFVLSIGFLILAGATLATPFAPNLPILFIIQLFTGIANAMSFVVVSGLVLRRVPFGLRSAVTGVFQSVFGVGMVLGPVISGFMAEQFGLRSAYYGMAGLALIATMLTIYSTSQQGENK